MITTHQHWDHHRALAEVVDATGATTYAGEPDADAVTEQTGVAVDALLKHGDRIPVGDCVLETIALAGHTPGSVALLYTTPTATLTCSPATRCSPGACGNTFGDADASSS